ncbi:MAG: LamG domain-containing protein [Proteobacteria bacterium]|nr:LamG domain-containing protein [Pseudomonadota bacterium]
MSIVFEFNCQTHGTILGAWQKRSNNRSFIVGIDRHSRVVFAVSEKGGTDSIKLVRSKDPINYNTWYHCVVVADGSALKIYLNGMNNSSQLSPYNGKICNLNHTLRIGGGVWFGNYSGTLRNITIYKGAIEFNDVLILAGKHLIKEKPETLKELLYFSFATPKYDALTHHDLEIISQAAFSGVCVRLIGAYDNKRPYYTEFEPVIKSIKERHISKVWPVVFFNRFFGSPTINPCHGIMQKGSKVTSYAKKTNGLDLSKSSGALFDFINIFKLALKIAKETNSPGIFIDSEAYNCYDAYKITDLAKRHRSTPDEVIAQLYEIGKNLADTCNSTYPDALLFFYIADLGCVYNNDFQKSITYIVEGILKRAKDQAYSLKVIDGWTGQYIYFSLGHAKHVIESKIAEKYDYLERYPNLELAGVVAPFESYSNLPVNSWIRKSRMGTSDNLSANINTINDFFDIYNYLFSTFNYVWVYGATQSGDPVGYDIFSSKLPDSYNKILERSLMHYGE